MSFSMGNTFINKSQPNLPEHLWMIISYVKQPLNEVVIVNFTTFDNKKDSSCVLDKGEHPFVKHRTSVNYYEARIVSSEKLTQLESYGLITRKEDLDDEVLAKILEGAATSPFLKLGIRKFLEDQNLI